MTVPIDPASSPKLTTWKKEPKLSELQKDFEATKSTHAEHISQINKWNDLSEVKNSAKPTKVKGRSAIQPKLIRRQAEWRYSALSEPFNSSSDMFEVTPVTHEDTEGAKQNEMVLNWQFRTKIDRIKFIDDYVHTVVDEGTVVVRVGWKRCVIEVKEMAPIYEYYPVSNDQEMQMLQSAASLKDTSPSEFLALDPALQESVNYSLESQQLVLAVKTGEQEIKVEKVKENQPTVDVLDPNNVYIDPSAQGDFNKALFIVFSFETSKSDLEKEKGRYKNLKQVDWANHGPSTDADHVSKTPQDFQFSDEARKKVVAYEYWGYYDITGSGKLSPFVATWIGSTLIRMEISPFTDEKLPFVLATYNPRKREMFGEPDAELLEDNQKIMGALTRGIVDVMGKSANGQQGFAKGMLDPLNRRRYDQGNDYEFNPTMNPTNGIITHKYPELPQSAFAMLTLQNQEAESLTGVKSFSGGISGESYGNVATGIRGALDAASKREMSILRRLANGIKEIGKKIISMNADLLSEEEVIHVTNEEFVTIKREDLKGSYDLKVDISTAEVDAAKSQDLSFMLQTIGPNTDQAITMMVMAEIADLKRMPELAEKLRNFQPPPPDPVTVKMAEIELQNKMLEGEKLRAEIAQINATARQKNSAADAQDLDFVEQESGTKHARDVDRIQSQARGNQDLEVTKSLLKPNKADESRPNTLAAMQFNQLVKQDDTGQISSNRSNIQPINGTPVIEPPPEEISSLPIPA